MATFTDVSTSKAMEQQVQQRAFYDALTQLPNRRLFDGRLSQAMASSKRLPWRIDVSGFGQLQIGQRPLWPCGLSVGITAKPGSWPAQT